VWVNTPYRDRYGEPSGSWAGAGNLEHPFREGNKDKDDGKGDEKDGQKKKKRDSRPGLSRAHSTFLPAVTAITASRKIAGSFREKQSLPNRIQEEGGDDDDDERAEKKNSVLNGSTLSSSSSSSSSQAQQSFPPGQGGFGGGHQKNAVLPMIPRWDLGEVDGKPMGEARLVCGTLPNPASGSWENSSSLLGKTIKKGRILRGAMAHSCYCAFLCLTTQSRSLP